ncbi:FAD-dependent oxidoreductase [Rhodoligotrophos appendicifer]|uniref:FAD-dependent oxidoreductase n=1 Tax=Rhodoligotrophos appendicifer TaxID=987056 RepID=UPI001FEC3C6A
MLANELGRRGVDVVLVDLKASTAVNPQANATQARSMEHFRRLGFSEEIRALGLPEDYPTDIAYFTRFSTYEIARVELPSARDAKVAVRNTNGSFSAAEPPHRVSQKFVEGVLAKHAKSLATVSVNFNWALTDFTDTGHDVEARLVNTVTGETRTIRALYLFGADGPRSLVRRQLGFDYIGEGSADRDFMGGRMLAMYIHAPQFYEFCPHPRSWMYWTFNGERRALMAAVDGTGEFAFHTQLRNGENVQEIDDKTCLQYFEQAMGISIPLTILSRDSWLAGRTLVADRFHSGRVFLGGDAVHLFTPTGGMGYNTAIEDAVNIGWKFAAVVKGIAPPSLLDSYEAERRPVAQRNTMHARRFADSVGLYRPSPAIEDDTSAGIAARRRAGAYLSAHARAEFNIPGFTFGGRYDGSPIIVSDGTPAPPDSPTAYVPTGNPGGRAPHVWLKDGRSLFDLFGFEWTLLRLGGKPTDPTPYVQAAAKLGVELKVVDCNDEEAFDLYEADLALIRPDQVVAWRNSSRKSVSAEEVLGRVTGRQAVQQ